MKDERLDYEGLYALAKAQARREAEAMWPPEDTLHREYEEARLTSLYYSQYVTPEFKTIGLPDD
jgi:hypothetical protein